MCQKWFAKFHAGDFSLDDAPWSGRPVEIDNDQSKTLSENNQRYTTQEIADTLKISKSIKLLVKMKNVFYFMEKNHMNENAKIYNCFLTWPHISTSNIQLLKKCII